MIRLYLKIPTSVNAFSQALADGLNDGKSLLVSRTLLSNLIDLKNTKGLD